MYTVPLEISGPQTKYFSKVWNYEKELQYTTKLKKKNSIEINHKRIIVWLHYNHRNEAVRKLMIKSKMVAKSVLIDVGFSKEYLNSYIVA